jgi:hypothetical protein
MDRREPRREVVRRAIRTEPGKLIVPAPVSAEVDYLLGERLGRRARRAFLEDIAAGRFRVVCLSDAEYELALWYDQQYADLDVGLADLSVVLLAHRFRTHRLLTFDERHFRTLRPVDGGDFVLLPQDEER